MSEPILFQRERPVPVTILAGFGSGLTSAAQT